MAFFGTQKSPTMISCKRWMIEISEISTLNSKQVFLKIVHKTWMNLSTTNEESNIKNVELDFSTLSCQQQKSKSKMTDEFRTAVTRTCKKHWTAVLAATRNVTLKICVNIFPW